MRLREFEVGVGGEQALRIIIDQPVERIDGFGIFLPQLMAPRDVHQAEGRVVTVRSVGEDHLKIADAGGAAGEPGKQAPHVGATAIQQIAGNAILQADDFVKALGVRVPANETLKRVKGIVELAAREPEFAYAVEGLGGINGIGVTLDDFLVAADRRPFAAAFLGQPGAIHEVDGLASFGTGDARKYAALDSPAGLPAPAEAARTTPRLRSVAQEPGAETGKVAYARNLPANQRRTVGQARPKGDKQGVVTALDPAEPPGFIERNRDGGRGRVAVTVEIDEKALHRELEVLRDGLDDAEVRLVGDHEPNLISTHLMMFQNIPRRLLHRSNGNFEDFLALHLEEMVASED